MTSKTALVKMGTGYGTSTAEEASMVTDLKAKGKALAAQHRASLGRYSKSAKREAKRQLLSSLATGSEGAGARKELKRLSTHVIAKRKDSGVMNPYTARGKATRNPQID